MNKTTSFKTQFFSGDVIWMMAGIKRVCAELRSRAEFYLWLNREGAIYEGAEHPYGRVMQNQYSYQMLKPLIESQPYIDKFVPWKGENIIVDLDITRVMNINLPHGNIGRWASYVFPDMAPDLSIPWINLGDFHVDPDVMDKILINRTSRYQNGLINYFILRKYKEQLLFVGMPEEHKRFCEEWDIDIPHYQVSDFLQLACAIKSCKFFIGNQSMCFAIAEAVKAPRILEIFPFAPNVMVSGKDGYDFINQAGLEYFIEYLNEKL